MRTITTEVYKFEELDEETQERVIENNRDINVDYQWWDFIYDDVKKIGKILGINIKNIYFSRFYSQGDGACFEGSYSYAKESVKKIKEYAPLDEELHKIAKDLYLLQKNHFYRLSANVEHSGHYYHEFCTNITVYDDDYYDISDDTIEGMKEILRSFMQWIYSILEKECNYLTSDEAIKETIIANEYEFTEEGEIV